MATFSKIELSGSTNGRLIKVAATATAGTTIHTGSSTATTRHDERIYKKTLSRRASLCPP